MQKPPPARPAASKPATSKPGAGKPPAPARPGNPPPKAKPAKPFFRSADTLVGMAAGILALIAAVVGTTMYLNMSMERDAGVAYATFDPINVKTRGFTLRASIAIQTRAGQSEWAKKNRAKLEGLFQRTLSAADPAVLHNAAGIQALQAKLRDDANRALDTDNLEAVYITDFLVMDDAE